MLNNTRNELPTTSWTGPAVPRSNDQPSTVEAETAILIPSAIRQGLSLSRTLGGASQGAQAGTELLHCEQDLEIAPREPPTGISAPFSEEETLKLARDVRVYRPTAGAASLHGNSVSLETRQYWEGRVTIVRENEFGAVVQDRSNVQNPDEEVVFGLDEISDSDRALLKSGAGFYWFIGRERTPAGQQKNVSFIHFKRTPSLSRSALDRAAKMVKRFRAFIGPMDE
jgi:hypothetical protein